MKQMTTEEFLDHLRQTRERLSSLVNAEEADFIQTLIERIEDEQETKP